MNGEDPWSGAPPPTCREMNASVTRQIDPQKKGIQVKASEPRANLATDKENNVVVEIWPNVCFSHQAPFAVYSPTFTQSATETASARMPSESVILGQT